VKIGFDAKRFFNNFTGLGNYSRFVIDALSKYYPDHKYFLYSPNAFANSEVGSVVERENVSIITPPVAYKLFRATSLWRSWGISNETTVKTLDVFHGLSHELPAKLPISTTKIVTIHDLIFIRYPELYNSLDVLIYKKKVSMACRQADSIIATSMQTRQDVVDFLKVDPSKIQVVYQGCHPNFKNILSGAEISNVKRKYALPHNYILSVGTIEERKNVLLLIKALSLLRDEVKKHLVIVGRPTAYKERLIEVAKRNGVLDRITFLHNVSFKDLPGIYQGAEVFVYPSFFEGFGIPIVEALESSVPVIAATGSCLSEAGGNGSIYINPNNEQELAAQLERVISDVSLRKQMVAEGKKHVQLFQPKEIAESLMQVYKNV
jgi:glycosyltransferase involved in cell wall biosynthesis